VPRLWALCHLLRDDGITYHQYVEELAPLLYLKMAKQLGMEKRLPAGARWDDLLFVQGEARLPFYRSLLARLSTASDPGVREIFGGGSGPVTTALRGPQHLLRLTQAVDALVLAQAGSEGLGELYEGLLEKNAGELKSGAGQYFTPRPLVESIVALVKPQPGEAIQDPAAGTGGFLVYAHRCLQTAAGGASPRAARSRAQMLGVELVPSTRRLALMNLSLHQITGEIRLGDTLTRLGQQLPPADVILTNPPFGNKRGSGATDRPDLAIATANKQLLFLQHCYRSLKPGGRAAVIVPDNVLFEEHAGRAVRAELLSSYSLHTLLRLPTGIFYAPGVKTNVLFFSRPERPGGGDASQRVWFYDLRTGQPPLGKRTPLTRDHLRDFERAFGEDPYGRSPRADGGPQGRFRAFSREELRRRGDSLDLCWLAEPPPAAFSPGLSSRELCAEILGQLRAATAELEALAAGLLDP
jgi:type I restriction enzyme M protein